MSDEYTLASMRRLLAKQGKARISLEAAEAFRIIVGEYSNKLARAAYENMVFESRKTILERDISEGIKTLEKK